MVRLQFFDWQKASLLFLLMLLPFLSFTQDNSGRNEKFIKTVPLAALNLDPFQMEKYLNLQSNPRYKSITPIVLEDLPGSQKNGVLTFTVPGMKRTFAARGHRVEAFENGDYDWYARLLTKKQQAGDIHIIKNGQVVFGQINIENEVYLIEDLGQKRTSIGLWT